MTIEQKTLKTKVGVLELAKCRDSHIRNGCPLLV